MGEDKDLLTETANPAHAIQKRSVHKVPEATQSDPPSWKKQRVASTKAKSINQADNIACQNLSVSYSLAIMRSSGRGGLFSSLL